MVRAKLSDEVDAWLSRLRSHAGITRPALGYRQRTQQLETLSGAEGGDVTQATAVTGPVPPPAGSKRLTGRSRRSICLYTPSADPSGMGAHMADLAEAYVADHEVSFLCRPTPGGRRLLDRVAAAGARVVPLPGNRDPAFAPVIAQHLRESRPDVFHSHVGWGWEDWPGVHVAREVGVPAVAQTHHLPFLLSDRRKPPRLLRALRPVDHLIAVSEGLRRSYERVGVPPELFTTVPNGIRARGPGPGRAAARHALGLSPEQPVVMTAGRLINMKGHRFLVEAVSLLIGLFPDLAVPIFGRGPLHESLQRRAVELGVAPAVRFLGHRTDARMLLDAADIFVLPSRHEGMPLAAIEAMDAGLPVVATRVIGSEEVVLDGHTGTLVRSEDPVALARALAGLLADRELRSAYGRAGRRRYLACHSVERMALRTLAVYEQVLHAGSGRARIGA
jgi:glycosyltransferase involved in cell wall biosynthesis